MTIKCWTIALIKDTSGPVTPIFYYHDVKDVWMRRCEGGCLFFDEASARTKLEELDVHADVIEGSVE